MLEVLGLHAYFDKPQVAHELKLTRYAHFDSAHFDKHSVRQDIALHCVSSPAARFGF